jgi:hypothetical protein
VPEDRGISDVDPDVEVIGGDVVNLDESLDWTEREWVGETGGPTVDEPLNPDVVDTSILEVTGNSA